MMQLSCDRDPTEDAFDDMLKDIDRSKILKVLECHATEDDDSHYAFLIWIAEAHHTEVIEQLDRNCEEISGASAPHEIKRGLVLWTEVTR